jgi:hypothetical protein
MNACDLRQVPEKSTDSARALTPPGMYPPDADTILAAYERHSAMVGSN